MNMHMYQYIHKSYIIIYLFSPSEGLGASSLAKVMMCFKRREAYCHPWLAKIGEGWGGGKGIGRGGEKG